MKTAYLIVICEKVTNKILSAAIWSSPEWEASQCLPDVHTYVAYSVKADTFQKGIDYIKEYISDPQCRYHYLEKYFAEIGIRELKLQFLHDISRNYNI